MGFFNRIGFFDVPRSMSELYKPAPKKFTYSSVLNKEILERRAADIAELTGRSVSLVIEDTLIERLLPHDEHAQHYTSAVLFGKKCSVSSGEWNDYRIKDALSDIFTHISAGVNWQPKYTNSKPLVDFTYMLFQAHEPSFNTSRRKAYPTPLDELTYDFDSLCSVLETEAKQDIVPGLEAQARRARNLLYPGIKNASVEPLTLIELIVSNWQALEKSTHTFRVLHHILAACCPWEDTAAERARFQGVCESVMSKWTRDEEEEKLRKAQAEIETTLVKHIIADGDYVLAPSSWCLVNPEDAPYAQYAGVIEIKGGERYKAPHFLFFLKDHDVKDITNSERDEIIDAAASIWPDLRKVQADEVALEYGPDGGIANMAEYSAAPCIGMFGLFDQGEYPLGEPPFGAEIVRVNNDKCGKGGER
ncbi:hypothetical protein [Eggerthella sp. YY7918]|uniref:hypothetical protein n=1 Tax=Eggerthella sp. (strain YY7918) TaxID=502558 RepID=UPI0002171293|nr:hypothetical protein [Eggerthella sp. YY7918]BAK45823.1 hypothetical protein EGYY_28460 [Eggerthella sp. YY7918]